MSDGLFGLLILLAALSGFVIGTLASEIKVMRQRGNDQSVLKDQSDVIVGLRRMNHDLGRALQEAGIPVEIIGRSSCGGGEETGAEWPEEI